MLNQETKRRIDSARDILVGKIPDPKAQVEQITTALIYKFMDDLDKESEELGGKAQFFVNEYEKYSWSKLLDTRLGGFERLNLYSEALLRMPQNPNLPQLFRNILKDSFLPYRDTETLNLFLKEINGFTYDHSEKLGDAYEYLLSVLGSQGDAGQFRTPRHIIDFIVEVVDPKKEDTILDPACGTAGFLISAYKHILKQNTIHRSGDQLTPEEKTKLMQHFVGYDISPDMVKLSLVNMYLHSFPNPNVFEYDTLTNEERWGETYDVIMANPPFMSPKGGIRPHKRFSIQANRSEVLFVDYIAEHLTTQGRAGVIVPEGIIFQSGNAYKSLRKLLVEKYLFAVVSLPAGVFQPYSGVKTSILLMDKQLAKKSDSIIFVKVENDGFDLGAQRRAIEKNDLTKALSILKKYKQELQDNREVSDLYSDAEEVKLATIVQKAKIAESGEYGLSGERYKENLVKMYQKWPIVELNQVATIISGQSPEGKYYNDQANGLPFYQGKADFGDFYLAKPTTWTTQVTKESHENDILMSVRAPVGPVNLAPFTLCIGRGLTAIRPHKDKLNYLFLFYLLRSAQDEIKRYSNGSTFEAINRDQIGKIKIPLPPLEVQKELIAELESFQKIIDGAKQVVENYIPAIQIVPDWKMLELGEISEISTGTTPSTDRADYYVGSHAFIKTAEINNCVIKEAETHLSDSAVKDYNLKVLPNGTVLMAMYGQGKTRGQVALLEIPASITQNAAAIQTKENVDPKYLYYYLLGQYKYLRKAGIEGHISHLNLGFVKKLKIYVPAIDEQKKLVAQIDEEQNFIDGNKKLIEIFEQKVKDKIANVWGESEL